MKIKNLRIVLLIIGAALVLSACSAVIDSEGAKFGNPRDFAQATHIARLSESAALATAQAVSIEATKQTADIQSRATRDAADIAARATQSAIQAQADKAQADKISAAATVALAQAKTEQDAQPAALAGKSTFYLLGYTGVGVGALVLLVGLAFGLTAWVNKRATTIYPDVRGQFPVIVRKGAGFIAYHDPNRSLGPGTVLHTPGLLERAGYALALARGQVEPLVPGAEYPQSGSEPAMLQVASQEQAAQVVIAERSNRPKLLFAVGQPSAEPARSAPARGRMPHVAVVNDPQQIEAFERKLLEAGDE